MTHVNPVGPHASTVSIITMTSESRLLKPRCWAPHGELPKNPKVASIQHPPTPTPSVAGRNSKYRCKAVHSLPVSTTSYFRHVVSTVQSSISSANNGTVLNRHRRRLIFDTFHIHNQIHLRPVSIFPFFPNDSFSSNPFISNKDLYLASDRNHSTSIGFLLSTALLTILAY